MDIKKEAGKEKLLMRESKQIMTVAADEMLVNVKIWMDEIRQKCQDNVDDRGFWLIKLQQGEKIEKFIVEGREGEQNKILIRKIINLVEQYTTAEAERRDIVCRELAELIDN